MNVVVIPEQFNPAAASGDEFRQTFHMEAAYSSVIFAAPSAATVQTDKSVRERPDGTISTEQGFGKGVDGARGQRRRRTYAMTAAGRRALAQWLTDAGAAPLEIRDPLMLRLFFADVLPEAGAASLLELIRYRSLEAVSV